MPQWRLCDIVSGYWYPLPCCQDFVCLLDLSCDWTYFPITNFTPVDHYNLYQSRTYEQQSSYRICQQWQQLISEQLLGKKIISEHSCSYMKVAKGELLKKALYKFRSSNTWCHLSACKRMEGHLFRVAKPSLITNKNEQIMFLGREYMQVFLHTIIHLIQLHFSSLSEFRTIWQPYNRLTRKNTNMTVAKQSQLTGVISPIVPVVHTCMWQRQL